MPETVEGQEFDDKGLCRTCQSQAQKKNVDWKAREKALRKILTEAKENAKGKYDCIVPISGGKDSLWQLHVIVKEYGMNPLAVTYDHGGFCKTGLKNLAIAINKMGIDHLMFKNSYGLIRRMQKRAIELMGDPCWHCHTGVTAITLQTAVEKNIPLIIWGESTAEHGRATYDNPDKFDRDYFLRVSGKFTLKQFACDYITEKELSCFDLPSVEDCKKLNGIHLGDYVPWDVEKQVKFLKETYGWTGREISGAYKDYKSAECSFAGYHDFPCYQKRGYGRASIQASDDIRAGTITREQGFEIAQKYEQIEPKDLHEFLAEIDMTPVEYRNAIEKLKHPAAKNINLPADKEWRKCEEDGKPFMQRLMEE
jgi:N-acetyl sugar amidotransferase